VAILKERQALRSGNDWQIPNVLVKGPSPVTGWGPKIACVVSSRSSSALARLTRLPSGYTARRTALAICGGLLA